MRRENSLAPRRKPSSRLSWAVPVILGATAIALGIAMVLLPLYEVAAMRGLASDARADDGSVDLAVVADEHPEAKSWLTVLGAGIDLPVAQATDDTPEWFLRHSLDGTWSIAGTPFIDHRTFGDATHVIVYGHHLSLTGGSFSEIFDTWRQDRFDAVLSEGAVWQTSSGGSTQLQALCALEVDADYTPIQVFAWTSIDDYRSWLHDLAASASARAAGWEELAGTATRDVTLVTCSSTYSGQRGRCLVILVATDAMQYTNI